MYEYSPICSFLFVIKNLLVYENLDNANFTFMLQLRILLNKGYYRKKSNPFFLCYTKCRMFVLECLAEVRSGGQNTEIPEGQFNAR